MRNLFSQNSTTIHLSTDDKCMMQNCRKIKETAIATPEIRKLAVVLDMTELWCNGLLASRHLPDSSVPERYLTAK